MKIKLNIQFKKCRILKLKKVLISSYYDYSNT